MWEKSFREQKWPITATYPWFVQVLVQECNKQGWVTSSTMTDFLRRVNGAQQLEPTWAQSNKKKKKSTGFLTSHWEPTNSKQTYTEALAQKQEHKFKTSNQKKKKNKYPSDMPKLESDLLQSLEEVGGKGGSIVGGVH